MGPGNEARWITLTKWGINVLDSVTVVLYTQESPSYAKVCQCGPCKEQQGHSLNDQWSSSKYMTSLPKYLVYRISQIIVTYLADMSGPTPCQLEEWSAQLYIFQQALLLLTYNKVVSGVLFLIVDMFLLHSTIRREKPRYHYSHTLCEHVACKYTCRSNQSHTYLVLECHHILL